MFRLSNISIGLKLSIMSGIGILLVVGMIVGSILTGREIESSNHSAEVQNEIGRGLMGAKAALRGLEMAVKDVRISRNREDIEAAAERMEEHLKAYHTWADPLVGRFTVAANRERVEKAIALAEQYDKTGKQIVPLKEQLFALQPKLKSDDAAVAKSAAVEIDALDQKQYAIAKSTLPIAAEAEKLIAMTDEGASAVRKKTLANAEATMEFSSHLAIGLSILTALAMLGSAILGIFTIAKPLKALVRPLQDVAGGNLAIVVPGIGRKDEVGQIADAVAEMAKKVSSSIGHIKSSGREVTNASAEISTSTTELSHRTEEQAASLEETSAAMEELSATVKKNAENAQQASQSASVTRGVADRGGEVVAEAVEAMAKIEESSRKISDIIGVIDEIARQTNLLALNAAVEAARAGEAGRGFAVVASEVRSLAQRSSQAAKDIKDLITNSNVQVKDGVELVNKAGESLTEIVESIKKVAAVVSDIAHASIEQATGLEQINKALTQMDEVTQQNSALVEENAATAKTLEQQAKAMDEQVAIFQIAIGERAALASASAPAPHHATPVRAKVPTPKPIAEKRGEGAKVVRLQQGAAALKTEPDWTEF